MNAMIPLLVFFPFLAAPLSYLIGKRSRDSRNFFVIAVSAVALAFALAVWHLESGESFETVLAGGLSFRADGFRGLYSVVIALMWFMTSLLSREYFSEHYRNRNRYYFFLLLTLGASFGVFLSADFFTAFVFFEILSFTSFVWVIQDETPGADRAAKTYLAVAVIGGLVLFMGLALLYHRFGDEDDAPAHYQIDGKREPWPTPYRIDFIEDAAYHDQPLEGKNRPAKPAAHYPDEDGGVAAGNHHIDADVVELAQNVLRLSFSYPMISGAAQEHEEHADNEADDTERHLPADIGSEPHQPDGAQGKDGSSKVR